MHSDRKEERLALISEAYERLQSWRAVSRELGIPRSTVRHYQRIMGVAPLPIAGGDAVGMVAREMALPKKGEVKRYLLTCAQNNTHLHEAAWANLIALSEHYEAQLFVSRFAYNKTAWAQQGGTKPGTHAKRERLWYDPELEEFLCDERVQLAPNLMWCGESNIIPTAIRPLSGLESYTGRDSAIFPHVKIAMESVASGKHEGVKLLFTTGTVTLKNYIQRKAGLKAEFHHTYGALLVEVNHKGRWFCRQLNADRKGVIYDLDLRAKDGEVTDGHRVEAITFGDIHAAQLDEGIADLGWGRNPNSMFNVLQPEKVFLHDLIDFRARNHHDRGDPHLNFQKFMNGADDVQKELHEAAELLIDFVRQDCDVFVVQSNHDNALIRWLREADYRLDPTNALIFLTCQKRMYEAIAHREEGFHLLEWILRQMQVPIPVWFLRIDESFVICKGKGQSGIECGMHGHLGANGTRGTARGFSRMGRKSNVGHSHSCGIIDGVFVAGTSSNLDAGYNTGPSSWTHSHIVTYPNGKRAIVTMYDGAWRAE